MALVMLFLAGDLVSVEHERAGQELNRSICVSSASWRVTVHVYIGIRTLQIGVVRLTYMLVSHVPWIDTLP